LMEVLLAVAKFLAGVAALWAFWDKLAARFRAKQPQPVPVPAVRFRRWEVLGLMDRDQFKQVLANCVQMLRCLFVNDPPEKSLAAVLRGVARYHQSLPSRRPASTARSAVPVGSQGLKGLSQFFLGEAGRLLAQYWADEI